MEYSNAFDPNVGTWLDAIIDSSYDGLFICDHEGKVYRIRRPQKRIDGVQAEEVIGKNVRDLVKTGLIDNRSLSGLTEEDFRNDDRADPE